jgi:hypothetical protein
MPHSIFIYRELSYASTATRVNASHFQECPYSVRRKIFLNDKECIDMDFDTRLELQLEILTLVNNIEKFAKLGWSTASLKSRLEFCHSQLGMLMQASNDSFSLPNAKEPRYQYCA